jgi:hypothetical protein
VIVQAVQNVVPLDGRPAGQPDEPHGDAGQAVAALAGVGRDERVDHPLSHRIVAKALECLHLMAGQGAGRPSTGWLRDAVDQHDAGAALLEPAAELRG